MSPARTKPVIDPDMLLEAVRECTYGLSNLGYCTSCGAEHDGLEPDARRGHCEECGKHTVYGAEELLIMGYAQ